MPDAEKRIAVKYAHCWHERRRVRMMFQHSAIFQQTQTTKQKEPIWHVSAKRR